MSDGAASWSPSNEAVAVQDVGDSRAAGQVPLGLTLAQDVKQLLEAPAGMAAAELKERGFDFGRRAVVDGLVGVRALEQAVWSFVQVSLNSLVAGLATDVVESAEVGNGMSV